LVDKFLNLGGTRSASLIEAGKGKQCSDMCLRFTEMFSIATLFGVGCHFFKWPCLVGGMHSMIMHGMFVIHDVYIPRKISFLIGFPELRGMCIEHVVYIPCNVSF
jgi:hypothetical protein